MEVPESLKWGAHDFSNPLAESCILFPRISKEEIEKVKKEWEEKIQMFRKLRREQGTQE